MLLCITNELVFVSSCPGKECDLDKHCGVLDPERKKLCTRLLTCNVPQPFLVIPLIPVIFRFSICMSVLEKWHHATQACIQAEKHA